MQGIIDEAASAAEDVKWVSSHVRACARMTIYEGIYQNARLSCDKFLFNLRKRFPENNAC